LKKILDTIGCEKSSYIKRINKKLKRMKNLIYFTAIAVALLLVSCQNSKENKETPQETISYNPLDFAPGNYEIIDADPVAVEQFASFPSDNEIVNRITIKSKNENENILPNENQKLVALTFNTLHINEYQLNNLQLNTYHITNSKMKYSIRYNISGNNDDNTHTATPQKKGNIMVFYYLVNTYDSWDYLVKASVLNADGNNIRPEFVNQKEFSSLNFQNKEIPNGFSKQRDTEISFIETTMHEGELELAYYVEDYEAQKLLLN